MSCVRRLLDGDRSSLPAAPIAQGEDRLLEVLVEDRECYRSMPATRAGDEPPPRSWRPPPFGPSHERVVPGLLALADDVVLYQSSGVAPDTTSAGIKDCLAVLWLSPVPPPYRTALSTLILRCGQAVQTR